MQALAYELYGVFHVSGIDISERVRPDVVCLGPSYTIPIGWRASSSHLTMATVGVYSATLGVRRLHVCRMSLG